MKRIRFQLDPKTIGLLLLAGAGVWLLIKLWMVLVLVVAGMIATELAKEIQAEDVATEGDASAAADVPMTTGQP